MDCRWRNTMILILLVMTTTVPVASAHPGSAIAVNADGRVYFVDTGGGVFSIERNGRVIRLDGPAFHWFAFDPSGRFRSTPLPSIPDGELRAVGVNPTLVLSSDVPVVVANGTFYYPRAESGGRVTVIGVAPSGSRSLRAVLPPVRSGGKVVRWLNGLAAGPNSSLYYTEDTAVRMIDARGRVTTLAAAVTVPNCASIPGIGADLRPDLRGLVVSPDGTVYVAASGCGAVLKISPRGVITPILRTSPPWSPTAVAMLEGDLYVLEYSHTASDDRREWFPRVRKLSRSGTIATLAITNRR